MRTGDLVIYRGWGHHLRKGASPMGIVVDQRAEDSDFHCRVRVMWIGEEVPIQASVLSTTKARVTAWVSPKYFEVING